MSHAFVLSHVTLSSKRYTMAQLQHELLRAAVVSKVNEEYEHEPSIIIDIRD